MEKRKKIILVLSLTALAAAALVIYRRRRIQEKEKETLVKPQTGLTDGTGNSGGPLVMPRPTNRQKQWPAKQGDSSFEIWHAQKALNLYKGANLTVDGNLGNQTRKELNKYGIYPLYAKRYNDMVNSSLSDVKF